MNNPFKRMRWSNNNGFCGPSGNSYSGAAMANHGYTDAMFAHFKDGSEMEMNQPRYLPGYSAEMQEQRNQEAMCDFIQDNYMQMHSMPVSNDQMQWQRRRDAKAQANFDRRMMNQGPVRQ